MDFINVRLLSHPVNWAFVWATLLLVAIAYKTAHDAWCQNNANNSIAPD